MSQKEEKSSRSNNGKTKVKYVYLDKYIKNIKKVDYQLNKLKVGNEIQQQLMEELDKDIRRIHIRLIVLLSTVGLGFLIYFLYNL